MDFKYKTNCRLFTGYKPCRYKRSCEGCPHFDPVENRVAIVSLEALGAVLRSTCLLHPIKRKFPRSHITWITYPNAKALLQNNPLIDRIITMDASTAPLLAHLQFDQVYAVDKSMEAGALAESLHGRQKFGFGLDGQGVIRPLNPEAQYQFDVGLDDDLKFFKNKKPETQQTTESMALPWVRDPYVLELSAEEKERSATYRREYLQASGAKGIIGYNTGCSVLFPYKKFTVERSIEVIRMWRQTFPHLAVALLGGREDSERQEAMKAAFANDHGVINTPTTKGLREGVVVMDSVDMLLSGCSLGLHIGIALQKPVICWFGVSVAEEIDVYDRGIRLKAEVNCSPCWKKSCANEPKCFNQVSVASIQSATRELATRFHIGG